MTSERNEIFREKKKSRDLKIRQDADDRALYTDLSEKGPALSEKGSPDSSDDPIYSHHSENRKYDHREYVSDDKMSDANRVHITADKEERYFTSQSFIKDMKRDALALLLKGAENENDDTSYVNTVTDTAHTIGNIERTAKRVSEKFSRRQRKRYYPKTHKAQKAQKVSAFQNIGNTFNDDTGGKGSAGDDTYRKTKEESFEKDERYIRTVKGGKGVKSFSSSAVSGGMFSGAFSKKAVMTNSKVFITAVAVILVIVLVSALLAFSVSTLAASPAGLLIQSDETYAQMDSLVNGLCDELDLEIETHEKGHCRHKGEQGIYDGVTGGCGFSSDVTGYEISDSIPWRDVFSIYVAYTSSQNGGDISSYSFDFSDDSSRDVFRQIFHDTVRLMCRKDIQRYEENGEEKERNVRTVMLSTVSPEDYGISHGFSESQMKMLLSLTDDSMQSFWDEFFSHLPGTDRAIYVSSSAGGGTGIADAALFAYEKGYRGSKICGDLGVSLADWCGYFCSWCCKEADVDLTDAIGTPVSGYVPAWFEGARSHGIWHSASTPYVPSPGDMVIWRSSVYENAHITVVVKVENGKFYDVGGNEAGSTPGNSRIIYEGPFDVHSGASGSQWIKGYVETSKFDTSGGSMLENAYKITSFFRSKGYSKEKIIGILGNWACEGTNLDPTSVESIFDEPFTIGPRKRAAIEADFLNYEPFYDQYGGMKAGIGLAGYTGVNNDALMDFAEKRNRRWYDLALQTAFSCSQEGYCMSDWLKNTYRSKSYSSSYEATLDFMNNFEKPGYRNPATRNIRGCEIYDQVTEKYGSSNDESFITSVNRLL